MTEGIVEHDTEADHVLISDDAPERTQIRRTPTISFDSGTKSQPQAPTPTSRSKPHPTMSSGEEENTKIQAISNLRCPSPPPILNKVSQTSPPLLQGGQLNQPQTQSPRPKQALISILQESQPSSPDFSRSTDVKSPISVTSIASNGSHVRLASPVTGKDTVPAGGSLLRGRALLQAVVALVLAQTARNRNGRSTSTGTEELLSVENLEINDRQFSHHKAPSMHAHFIVDETSRHGATTLSSRSRSGSGSTTELRPVLEQDGGVGLNIKKSLGASLSTSSGGIVTKQTVDARLPSDDNKLHVLFGICGTVSTKKTRLIINRLEEIYGSDKISIQIIITSAAEHFVSRGEFPSSVQIWRDKDEWTTWGTRTDPVLHIELRRWADILVIAPLTSNTLSKIALGLCDNLLTNVVRAWNTQYPILVAPSMVSYAYNSPITKRHLKVIKEEMKWIEILKPTEKVVGSYGDIGMGGMMDWNEIVKRICFKAHQLGFNDDDDEDEDDDDDEEDLGNDTDVKKGRDEEKIRDKKQDSENLEGDDDDEDDDEDEEEDDDDDDDQIKLCVADEDEIEKVLKK